MRKELYFAPDSGDRFDTGTNSRPRVFLAGSIDMGSAEDWQSKAADVLTDMGIVVFNPRKATWSGSSTDASDPHMFSQVNWELDHLDIADVVLFNFSPGSKAPVSMLELGLYAPSGKAVVVCPDGFWRKGNVDLVCARHRVPVYETLSGGVTAAASMALAGWSGVYPKVYPRVEIRTKLA